MEPEIPLDLLSDVAGTFSLRICAKNMAGRGACTETNIVLNGWFLYYLNNF